MNTVLNKVRLLEIIERNRERHLTKYKAAKEAYKTKATKLLNKLIDRVNEGKTIEPFLNLPQLEDHSEDYTRAIEMLNLDTRTEIELSEKEFTNLVQDEWNWSMAFTNTVSNYLDE